MINYFNTQTDLANFAFYFKAAKPDATKLNAALKADKGLFDTAKWNNYKALFDFDDSIIKPTEAGKELLIDFITNNYYNTLIK